MTRAPAAPSARAVARPMPREAPVTRAVLLARFVMALALILGDAPASSSGMKVGRACLENQDFVGSSHTSKAWIAVHGAAPPALFRCRRRGRQPDQCRRTAAPYRAAIAQPA